MSSDYDVIVLGGGSPGEHCAGRAGRGRPARRRGRARAGRRRVLVLGLHPVEDAAAAGRGGARRRARRRRAPRSTSRRRSPGATSWSPTTPTPATGALAGRQRHRAAARHAAGSPARAWSRSTACATPPSTWSSRTAPTRSCRRSRACASSTASGPTARRPSMKAVPRRLLVLGGGPVGVELAQAVRRLGGEVVVVDGAEHVLAREPAPLGEALGEVLRREGIELVLGANATRRAPRRRGLRPRARRRRASCAATACSSPPAGGRGSTASAWRRSASSPTRTASRSTRTCARRERLWAIGDVNGIWPLTHVGKYEGDVVAANILGETAKGQLRGRSARRLHRPAGRGGRRRRRPLQRQARVSEVAKTATYTHAYAEIERLPDAAQRRRAADRRLRARPRGGRVAPAGDARDPRPRPARRPARHDPAVPDLLGDLRRRAEGAARRDREAAARRRGTADAELTRRKLTRTARRRA